ncbi:unnamed protein product [Prorocentrum cordatum]|uniref:RAP domain-containing protein n=1 Tax=Prorocentrum cordatum TaxID=2364126 RepID=A0ABN9TRX8_9DINO|nr:unnamed protein product [Polarella glacialis]
MPVFLSESYQVQVKNTFIDSFGAGVDEEEWPIPRMRRSRSEPALPSLAARAGEPDAEAEAPERQPEGNQELVGALDGVESKRTVDGVLEAAFQHLPSLGPDAIAEALYRAARRLRTPQPGVAVRVLLAPLLLRLQEGLAEIRGASRLSQLAWSLGKFGARSHPNCPLPATGMDQCMLHVCRQYPAVLAECSDVEITNTLWGLARLYPGGASGASGSTAAVRAASHAVVRRCLDRMSALTAQCLANSFWAVARLKVQGPDAAEFVARALGRLSTASELSVFTTQGIANVLWALAQLRMTGACAGPADGKVQNALVQVAEASSHRLGDFQPQELSMVAWSLAKLYESKGAADHGGAAARRGRCAARPMEVDVMLMRLASEATRRIDMFEDQGISNIAWALVTLGLAGGAPATAPGQLFVETAMDFSSTELWGYSTQAVANLLWACVRLDVARLKKIGQVMARFCSAAAEVVTQRMMDQGACGTITWKDLSGVAAALSHSKQKSQPVMRFVTLLAHRTAKQVSEGSLTAQQMLNIALSVARMRVPPHEMQALVDNIAACIAKRGDKLNQLDMYQWDQVQQWCPPRLGSRGPLRLGLAHCVPATAVQAVSGDREAYSMGTASWPLSAKDWQGGRTGRRVSLNGMLAR